LHELHTYVYYQCSHYVCLNCAVKMRVLCEKIDCPVCRQESKAVLCTRKPIDLKNINDLTKTCIDSDKTIAHSSSQIDPKEIGIYFQEEFIKNEYLELLANKCDICIKRSEQPTAALQANSNSNVSYEFNNFKDLESHMRKAHSKFYCELCLENVKLFSHERKYYNREELAIHKRRGDKDDYSFKGHPLCNFKLFYCINFYFLNTYN
jgi:E3 ubiquitin-protein ligase ZNF598